MLKGLRLRLTLLFLAAGALFGFSVAAAAYGVVGYFFSRTTDRALQHVMYEHMQLLESNIPPELQQAEQAWYSGISGLLPPQISASIQPLLPSGDPEGQPPPEFHDSPAEQALDAELASIFVLALNEDGRLLPGFNVSAAPFPPNLEAVHEAAEHGMDWRTIRADGLKARLLTYRVDDLSEPRYLQVGRSLTDQVLLQNALGLALLTLSAVGLIVLGAGSWWLSGRMIRPTEVAWERQRSFVANASHELRTPLTLIRSSAEIARRYMSAPSEASALVDDVLSEADHMSQLIEDQLLLSRLDADQLDLTLQPVPIHAMLEEIGRKAQLLPQAEGKELEVRNREAWVRGDPSRLRQVLLILLDNALQHTSEGARIELESEVQDAVVLIRVRDSGAGIPPDKIGQVFDRFYRVDEARQRGKGGAGLGLSIAQALVGVHNGTIQLESQLGVGTTVSIQLPAMER